VRDFCDLGRSSTWLDHRKRRFHPVGVIALVGIGAAIIGGAVLTPLLAIPVLGILGFSAVGPVAGNGNLFHNGTTLLN